MTSTYTTNLGLRKPANRDPVTYDAWDTVINTNMNTIDSVFGNRSYTEQNYIANIDNHTQSLDKLDMELKDLADVAPTANEKAALAGEGTPNSTNKFATKSYVIFAREETIFPEFPSATLKLSGSGTNTGTLSTDSEASGNYIFNFYKWLSAEVAFQDYDISIQWKVPETFVSWHATKAVVVDICTQENATTNCKVAVTLSKDGAAPTSSSADTASTVAATWYSKRAGTEVLYFAAADAVLAALAAGDTLNITIRVYSKGSKYAKIGAITFSYTG